MARLAHAGIDGDLLMIACHGTVHHIDTSLDNRVPLCRHHHRLVHEGGFTCEKERTGQVIFRIEFGGVIPETGYPPPTSSNAVIDVKNKLEDRSVPSRTRVARWGGLPRAICVLVGARPSGRLPIISVSLKDLRGEGVYCLARKEPSADQRLSESAANWCNIRATGR